MRTIALILAIAGLVAACLVGACSSICGFKRIDNFCARRLTDTDGQPEEDCQPGGSR